MPFPESPRLVFDENPLVEVICQLRFPPILTIAADVPTAFQDRLRELYPLYRRDDPFLNATPQLASMLQELPIPRPIHSVTHRFETSDNQRVISLGPEFVAFSDKGYTRWEVFREEIERARQALEEIYTPAFYTRAGLRYQDVIKKAELGLAETPWRDLLNPAFAGLLAAEEVRDEMGATRTNCVIRLDAGDEARLQISHGLVDESEGQTYGFDMDFFTTERSDGDGVRGFLDHFHRQAGYLFRWAILPPLRDALRPRPIDAG